MATVTGKHVLVNAAVRVNGTEISQYVSEVNINLEADDVDVTGMGQLAKDHVQGLRDESFEITVYQDFTATTGVDALLWPIYTGGTAVLMEVWPNGTTTSTTNPKYSGSVIMLTYNPLAGAVGDANSTQVTLPCKGTISRATT